MLANIVVVQREIPDEAYVLMALLVLAAFSSFMFWHFLKAINITQWYYRALAVAVPFTVALAGWLMLLATP